MGTAAKPTERDQFWLDQESKLAKSELTAKAYAAERGLSTHALYQARKRRRSLGLLPPVEPLGSRKTAPEKAVACSKVALRPSAPARAEFRLPLPNGDVLEGSGGELPLAGVDLLERLTSPR